MDQLWNNYYVCNIFGWKFLEANKTLVTQPMLQRWPNQTELRLMDSYIQLFVDSKNVSEKFLHRPP